MPVERENPEHVPAAVLLILVFRIRPGGTIGEPVERDAKAAAVEQPAPVLARWDGSPRCRRSRVYGLLGSLNFTPLRKCPCSRPPLFLQGTVGDARGRKRICQMFPVAIHER